MKRLVPAFAALVLAACSGELAAPVPAAPGIPYPADPFSLADLSEYGQRGAYGVSSLVAGIAGPDSKSHLQEGSGENSSSVAWTPGDTFRMLVFNAEAKKYYYADYTTEESGKWASFTTSSVLELTGCHSVYPRASKLTLLNGTPLLGFKVPGEQTAIPGDIAEGVNYAYAYSETQTSDLHFYNIPAILRFRVSGSIVSQVCKLTIKGQAPLSGDFTFAPRDGYPVLSTTRFSSDVTSNKVVLSGEFSAGEYYMAVVYPSVQKLSFIFEDASGNTVTRTSSREVEMSQGRIIDIGTINIGDAFSDVPPSGPTLYMKASTSLDPVTIAVVPDGFTEPELSDYELLARGAIDALFAVEPFSSYKEYFNVWFLYVASAESGSSITDGSGTVLTARNTYFGARWGSNGKYDDMRADDSTVFNFVKENCPDIVNGIHTVAEVPVLMISNDTRYGGICISFSDGRGYCIAPYSYGGGSLTWKYPVKVPVSDSDPSAGVRDITQEENDAIGYSEGDWRNIVVHEFGGHCLARLADEYWYDNVKAAVSYIGSHTWKVPFGLNVSATFDNPVWQTYLLDRKDYLVASNPLYSRIGVYQGGDVSPLNRWRSEIVSVMIDNRFYFSAWQRMLVVKRIMSLAHGNFDIDSFFALDEPGDPVRDAVSSGTPGQPLHGPARLVPQLPPPVLVD